MTDEPTPEPEEALRDMGIILLSDRDLETLPDALTNPPKPNVALREAFERYRTAGG